ncbi:RNA polymerase sigma factor [Paractinoplanes rishiriensis]|nr:RNA polymerase sigma factor [Actinoplanes rishiriensis]
MRASIAEPDRFATLYDRYAGALYRYAHQRVGPQAAQDVVAETFLAAFQRRTAYDANRPEARPWLFGILTRKLARYRRSERADYRALSRSSVDTTIDGPADVVAERVTAHAARAALGAALAGLPARDRDVLLLVAWGELSYEEVAAALGIPVGTVRSRLNRARRKVKESLGGVNPISATEDDR